MPTINRLAEHFAESFGIEASRSNGIARYLREAGMLSQGARGVNAPNATPLDATRLLIGNMLVWASAKSIPTHVAYIGGWVTPTVGKFRDNHPFESLEQAVTQIIVAIAQWQTENPVEDIGNEIFFCIVPSANFAELTISSFDNTVRDWNDEKYIFTDALNSDFVSDQSKPLISIPITLTGPFGLRPLVSMTDLFCLAKVVAGEKQPGWRLS